MTDPGTRFTWRECARATMGLLFGSAAPRRIRSPGASVYISRGNCDHQNLAVLDFLASTTNSELCCLR